MSGSDSRAWVSEHARTRGALRRTIASADERAHKGRVANVLGLRCPTPAPGAPWPAGRAVGRDLLRAGSEQRDEPEHQHRPTEDDAQHVRPLRGLMDLLEVLLADRLLVDRLLTHALPTFRSRDSSLASMRRRDASVS